MKFLMFSKNKSTAEIHKTPIELGNNSKIYISSEGEHVERTIAISQENPLDAIKAAGKTFLIGFGVTMVLTNISVIGAKYVSGQKSLPAPKL